MLKAWAKGKRNIEKILRNKKMFKSNTVYKNRYGDEYSWIADGDAYRFEVKGDSMQYCRYGAREGNDKLDITDLVMFDPSGGPYVSLGMTIDDKPITKLSVTLNGVKAECKEFVYPGGDCQE